MQTLGTEDFDCCHTHGAAQIRCVSIQRVSQVLGAPRFSPHRSPGWANLFLRSLRSFAAILLHRAPGAEPTCARALPTHYGLAVMSFSTLTWPCKPRSVSCED